MTKSEGRKKSEGRIPKCGDALVSHLSFVLGDSFVIRHLALVISFAIPPPILLQNFFARATRTENGARFERVGLRHVVIRDDELKIPRRVGRLTLRVAAAARRRMR